MQEVTLTPIEEEPQEVTLTPVVETPQDVTLSPLKQEKSKFYSKDIVGATEWIYDKMKGIGAAKLTDPMVGGFYGASGQTFSQLGQAADALSEATGLSKGDAFKKLSDSYQKFSSQLIAEGDQGILGRVAQGIGSAGWDIPMIMALGEWGLPIHGALTGYAEDGVEGALLGATTGALTHKILGGINLLPSRARIPAFAGFGAVTTPGDIKERTVGALTWTALGVSGRKGKITVNDFLQSYPKLRGGINNAKAIHTLKKINPKITAREIREAGGGVKALDAVVERLNKETEFMDTYRLDPETIFYEEGGKGVWIEKQKALEEQADIAREATEGHAIEGSKKMAKLKGETTKPTPDIPAKSGGRFFHRSNTRFDKFERGYSREGGFHGIYFSEGSPRTSGKYTYETKLNTKKTFDLPDKYTSFDDYARQHGVIKQGEIIDTFAKEKAFSEFLETRGYDSIRSGGDVIILDPSVIEVLSINGKPVAKTAGRPSDIPAKKGKISPFGKTVEEGLLAVDEGRKLFSTVTRSEWGGNPRAMEVINAYEQSPEIGVKRIPKLERDAYYLKKNETQALAKIQELADLDIAIQKDPTRPTKADIVKRGKLYGYSGEDIQAFLKQETAGRPSKPGVEKPEGDIKAGGVAYGMDLPQGIPGIRIDKLDAPYKVKKVLSDLTDRFESQLKSKTRTWKTVERQAKNKLKDLDVRDFLKTKKGQVFTDAEIEARRMLLGGLYRNVIKAEDAWKADPSSDNLAKTMIENERAVMGMKVMKGVATEQARSLGIFRKSVAPGEPQIVNIERILKATGGRIKSEEFARRLAMVDKSNPLEVLKFIKNNSEVKFKDKLFEAWVNALLSSPVTHAVNITSNTITLFGKPLETGLAAFADVRRGGKRSVYFGEVPHEIFGMFVGIKEGVRRAYNAWKHEITEEGISKLEMPKPAAIPGWKGRQVRQPGRALIAADEFFKAVLYSSDIYGQAYKIAKTEGMKGEGRVRRVAELVNDPSKVMIEAAKREGLYRTFQKDFGPHGKHVAQIRARYWPVQYILPFLRTPINIAKFGIERTPLNFFQIANKARKGQLKGEQLSHDLARAGLGSLTSAAVAIGVLEGMITGAIPVDPRERSAFYREGKRPYSIKIGDKWYGYGRLEPFGTVLGIAADATIIMQDISEGDKERLAGKIIMSVTQNLTNKTFLRGLSETMNAISDPERHGKNWIKNFAGTAVPSVVAHTARVVDPTIRDAKTTLDYIKSRIPGLSQTLPAKKDIYGKDLERQGPLLSRALSPIQISPERTDFVDSELQRLEIFPGVPSRKVGAQDIDRYEYEAMSEDIGKKLYEKLYRLLTSEGYARLSDERKTRLIRNRITEARTKGRAPYREKYK